MTIAPNSTLPTNLEKLKAEVAAVREAIAAIGETVLPGIEAVVAAICATNAAIGKTFKDEYDSFRFGAILDREIKSYTTPEKVAARMAGDLEEYEDVLNDIWEVTGPHKKYRNENRDVYTAVKSLKDDFNELLRISRAMYQELHMKSAKIEGPFPNRKVLVRKKDGGYEICETQSGPNDCAIFVEIHAFVEETLPVSWRYLNPEIPEVAEFARFVHERGLYGEPKKTNPA